MIALAIHSVMLPGGENGLTYFLQPDFSRLAKYGANEVIFAAMGQAFFTLSLGIGALAIFGSYIGKEKRLTGEAICVILLDTFVAIMSGLIIFPACSAYNVDPGAGPNLLFVTLPNVFNHMAGGQFWGTLFFLFMTFAAMSTVIAVFETSSPASAISPAGIGKTSSSWAPLPSLCCPCPVSSVSTSGAASSLWAKAPVCWIWKTLWSATTCCLWAAWSIWPSAPAVTDGAGITSSKRLTPETALPSPNGCGFI